MKKMQKTLKQSASCHGVGVHSGLPVHLILEPLPTNSGIIFERTDVLDHHRIPASWDLVIDTRFCTVLRNNNGVSVSTVEHLMATLAVFGITNLLIKID